MQKKLIGGLFLLPVLAYCHTASATNYYVSPRGSDSNSGTSTRPFKTLGGACCKVPAGANTIHLEPGVYEEESTCIVPPGISVAGSGASGKIVTILRSHLLQDIEDDPTATYPDKFLIQVYNSQNASLHDFRMEGAIATDQRAHGGIVAHGVTDLKIYNLQAVSFNLSAIYLSEARRSSVHHCVIEDSGHPNKASCSGGIMVGALVDSSIHDCTIREHRGAYGIKGWFWGWGIRPNPVGTNVQMPIQHALFYNNDIKVRQTGGWGNGQPNMAVELWNSRPENCEIFNSRFNECMSLTGEWSAPKTIRVHHNKFVLEPGYSYAMEIDTHDIEVDHNYFTNGCYPIACFGGRINGLQIHDNIFDRIENIQLIVFSNGLKDFQFVHNTVFTEASYPFLVLGNGESENLRIANNLFYKVGEDQTGEFIKLSHDAKTGSGATIRSGTLTIADNAFFHWKPTGSHPIVGDPRLALLGNRQNGTYFQPTKDSPFQSNAIGAPLLTPVSNFK